MGAYVRVRVCDKIGSTEEEKEDVIRRDDEWRNPSTIAHIIVCM